MAIIAAYSFCNRNFSGFIAGAASAGFENVAIAFYPNYYDELIENMTDEDLRSLRERLSIVGLTPVAAYVRSDLLAENGLDLLMRRLDGVKRFGLTLADTGAAVLDPDASAAEREADHAGTF